MLLNDLEGPADLAFAPTSDEILAMAAASLADIPATDLRSLTQRLLEPKI